MAKVHWNYFMISSWLLIPSLLTTISKIEVFIGFDRQLHVESWSGEYVSNSIYKDCSDTSWVWDVAIHATRELRNIMYKLTVNLVILTKSHSVDWELKATPFL